MVDAAVDHIWNTGITSTGDSPAQYPNPVFATALSDSVTLAFPSCPLLAFHLATATLNLQELSPLRYVSSSNAESSYSKLVGTAKLQFSEWTKAFTKLSSRITVRFIAADHFAFFHTLQYNLRAGEPNANWYRRQLDLRPLTLDKIAYGNNQAAPRRFDFIDASNLSDHVGALNLLISAAPLMKRSASIMYTEFTAHGRWSQKESVESLLCGQTRTLSILLGHSLIEYWTNATLGYAFEWSCRAPAEETGESDATPIQTRLGWKFECSQNIIIVDPQSLANFLLNIYLEMFKHENTSTIVAGAQRLASSSQSAAATSSAYTHYHRGSFVAVVKAVCRAVQTDAREVGRQLVGLINSNKSLMFGSDYAQSLALEMSKAGIYSEPWLREQIRRDRSEGTFCCWKEIPEGIAVTVVVPSSDWKPIFTEAASRGFGLTLQGHLRNIGRWHSIYPDVHIVFGTLTPVGSRESDDYAIAVQEDASGLLGNPPLIASFYVSSAALQVDIQESQVALCLQNTLQNAA
jgi:hypothetical protein